MQLAHHGWIGATRQIIDRRDLGADVVDEPARIGAGLHRRDRAGGAVLRGAGELLEPLNRLEPVPETPADAVLDVLRRRAAIDRGDLDLGEAEIGEGLADQGRRGHQARREDQHEDEVGGGRMRGEPADHSATSTRRIPGIAGTMSLVTTTSPGASPCSITSWRNATLTSRSSSRPSSSRRYTMPPSWTA